MTRTRARPARDDAPLDLVDLGPERSEFMAEVLAGLSRPRKTLPTRFLYDERGSRLFDQICELEEYYPTRTEIGIMQSRGKEMAAHLGPDLMLIELGSGSSIKTRLLLSALERPAAYVPVDISRDHLVRTAEALDQEFPNLEVLPVCADFTNPFEIPEPNRPARRRCVYFPGSTIGNLVDRSAVRLLSRMREVTGDDGHVLIGVDLDKDPAILERAYDDARGVTAAFNLNLLRRINRELGADFDLEAFRHRAVYARAEQRIEMYLVSTRPQVVTLAGRLFPFDADEPILTEYSHKYTLPRFATLAAEAGLHVHQVWTDPTPLFSIQLLHPTR